jgi:hypothetical protein
MTGLIQEMPNRFITKMGASYLIVKRNIWVFAADILARNDVELRALIPLGATSSKLTNWLVEYDPAGLIYPYRDKSPPIPFQPPQRLRQRNPRALHPLRIFTRAARYSSRSRGSSSLLDGSVQSGSRLTGTYTFDPDTADSNKDPTVGDYQHRAAGYGLLIKIGKYEFKTDPAKVHFLVEVVARPERHNYLLRSYNNVSSGPGVAADAINHIS